MLTSAPPRVKIISLISNPVTLSEKVIGICGKPALPTEGTAPMVPLGGVVSLGGGGGGLTGALNVQNKTEFVIKELPALSVTPEPEAFRVRT